MKQNPRPVTRQRSSSLRRAGSSLTIRLNPKELSEDELEYLYYLQHRHEPRVPMDEVMRKAGYELER